MLKVLAYVQYQKVQTVSVLWTSTKRVARQCLKGEKMDNMIDFVGELESEDHIQMEKYADKIRKKGFEVTIRIKPK